MLIILSFLLTFAVFGTIGFSLSRRIKRPVQTATWIFVAIAAGLSQWILPNLLLVSGGGFAIALNYSLEAVFLGILVGLVQRELKLRLH